MEYLSVQEMSERTGIDERKIRRWCKSAENGRPTPLPGAFHLNARAWAIPADNIRLVDGRWELVHDLPRRGRPPSSSH